MIVVCMQKVESIDKPEETLHERKHTDIIYEMETAYMKTLKDIEKTYKDISWSFYLLILSSSSRLSFDLLAH